MQLTAKDRAGLQTQALFEIEHSFCRLLVLSQPKRVWLARELADAIYVESYEHVGAEHGGSARRKLADAVAKRVELRNSDPQAVAAYVQSSGDTEAAAVGSVFLIIILGAILSWLIGRLLDWYFPAAAAAAPCESCNCFYGVPMLQGLKTYGIAAAMVAYAGIGFALGYVTAEHALEIVMAAAVAAGLRSGSKTDADKVIQKLK